MASLFQSLRWIHIAAGTFALILFWIPAIARKGGKAHVRAGWFYVVCMSAVVVTAFSLSALVFFDPVAVRGITRPLPPAELANFLRAQRVFATFLAYLAGVTLASGWQGIWAVETRREPKTMRTPFSLALNVVPRSRRTGDQAGLGGRPRGTMGGGVSPAPREVSPAAAALRTVALFPLDGTEASFARFSVPGIGVPLFVSATGGSLASSSRTMYW
jgi:hypothetical protein